MYDVGLSHLNKTVQRGNTMGYFSWQTCDSEASIMNVHSGESRTTYLLQPNGKPSIKEVEYDGYGIFNGVDAYVWLAEQNAEQLGIDLSGMDKETRRMLGIEIGVGYTALEVETGEYWCTDRDAENLKILTKNKPNVTLNIIAHWDVVPPQFNGKTANDLVEDGTFKMVNTSALLNIKYPIKLSFNPEAVYENHPASEPCPRQGYFEV